MAEVRDLNSSTVVVGRLNPLIFSPEWLQNNQIIGPEEAEAARESGIEVMAPNIASIALGTMKLVVEEHRFTLNVLEEPLIRAKDFPVNCFRLLSHTPVFAVGMNFSCTLQGDDIERWHRLGDMLAPKEPWGDFVVAEDGSRTGGIRALVMERQRASEKHPGHIRCSIQISENAAMEAVVQFNNHFHLGTELKPSDGAEAYRLIADYWDEESMKSQKMMDRVKAWADAA